MNTDKLGNGIGLIYATDITATEYIFAGIENNAAGVEQIKRHALTRSAEGFAVAATGSTEFVTIGANDSISSLLIGAVDQFDITSPIAITAGFEEEAAILLAAAVNSYIPVSGANYKAYVVGSKVIFEAPKSFGSTVNGSVSKVFVGLPGSQTIVEENVDGGSEGDEVFSQINGVRYYLNPTTAAVEGNILSPGTEEITEFIIMRGNQSQIPALQQVIADESITNLNRYDRFSLLNTGAGAPTNLNTITGDFAENDVIVVNNIGANTITVQDLSIGSGNIKMNPTSFAMLNDDYVIWFMYMNDATDGLVWREIYRNPLTVATDSITDVELANLSVGTPELKDLSVTAIKIALNTITQAQMGLLSVGTPELIDSSVTTIKLDDLSVTQEKLALLSVGTAQLIDGSVTEDKLANGSVTTDKLSADYKKGSFTMPISWETGELGIVKRKIPYPISVDSILVSVAKGIEATDDATVIFKNNAGTSMTGAQIDVPAGDPVGNDFTSLPTANNTFIADEVMQFETLKPNPGGKAVVTVCYTRT